MIYFYFSYNDNLYSILIKKTYVQMIYSCNDCKIFRAQIPRKFFEGVANGGYLLSHEAAR